MADGIVDGEKETYAKRIMRKDRRKDGSEGSEEDLSITTAHRRRTLPRPQYRS